MALGGGTFVAQNKLIPGTYINFVSLQAANAVISERGIATMALATDWGVENEIFEVTKEDFYKKSLEIFGVYYTDDKMKGLRDLFLNLNKAYFYRLTSGGVKADSEFATAKYCGTRGNDIKIIISKNIDDQSKYDVKVLLGNTTIDKQTVAKADELVDNKYVNYKKNATLKETASTPLTGGTNGTVDGNSHQQYLNLIEAYSYNIIATDSEDNTIRGMYVAFTKRMRDDLGKKNQLVLYDMRADYEGCINVKNSSKLVYWVAGLEASCQINKSCANKLYDGEFEISGNYTQNELEEAIKKGEYVLHNVNGELRVLLDINSLTTITTEKGKVFQENQTIRTIDQIANDIALIYNTRYIGQPNNDSTRIALWSDIVNHHEQLDHIGAIEDFAAENVKVIEGEDKTSVAVEDNIKIINAMEKLYMTVIVA